MTSTPNTPPSTSRPSRVKKKKKKHKSEDSTNNDLTQPLLDQTQQQQQQQQQQQKQEQDAIHNVVDVLKQDDINNTPPITSTNTIPPITNTNTTPPITNTPKILPPPQPRSNSSTSSLSRGISSHTIHRQFSHISSISNVTKTDPPPTLTILHDNPNITSNITELFTTSYGCLSFVIFIMSVMTYEVLQYRCVLPYAPFTVYTLIELLWLIFGLLLLATFLIHSNTFRITVQSSPILSLIILVYSLTFMCIPILGWMLFTGALAPHSQQTIIHRTNTMRLTYRVPACTDLDPPEAHLAALIVNIIHSVALCMSCMWCCAPTNNNKEGTYIVHRSAPPQPPHQEYNAPLLPPPAIPRQTTEVKIPGSTTQPKSVLIPISDTDEIDPETPLLHNHDSPTTHRPSITRVTHEPSDMVAIVV